jgi:hypothetical protein
MTVRAKEAEAQHPPTGSELCFAPLGIPTSIIADDSTLLGAAITTIAGADCCADAGDPRVAIRLRWNELATARVGFAVHVKGSCLEIEGGGVVGRADASTGRAECTVSRACGGEAGLLAEIGETLLLFLLARLGRIPVHAAAVMIGESAVVLAGPSGAGKSSLALAAQRQGLEVLSEDTTYVQLQPRLRIWGWPGAIHLHPADAPPGDYLQRVRGGRAKQAIPRTTARPFAERAILVGIGRGSGVELAKVDAGSLAASLAPDEPGFVLLRSEIELALRTLARQGAWRMTLSERPDDAISLLRQRFAPGAS